ncbi:MAG TPA: hypothetical protein VM890_15765, partial [Longimicrobium sp.]|nr:hypothetical protein [Longimicrobium sp.]
MHHFHPLPIHHAVAGIPLEMPVDVLVTVPEHTPLARGERERVNVPGIITKILGHDWDRARRVMYPRLYS